MINPKLSLLSLFRAARRRAGVLMLVAVAAFAAGGDDKSAQNIHQQTTNIANIANNYGINDTNNNKPRLRFHATDIMDIRQFLADAANGGGDAFDNFYKHSQIRLFNLLEDDITQRAEDALSSNFSAVRNADIFVQTPLGGRKGEYGAQVIGAFADDAVSALGWQVRAYDSGDDSKGVNAGVFYRRIRDGLVVMDNLVYDRAFLYGINAFADYEDSDYGGFLRYGIGGEVQSSGFSAAANYYIPITDEKARESLPGGEDVIAYSRRGFDANIRAALPRVSGFRYFNQLHAELSYYRFGGEGGADADSGLRYGIGFSPVDDLSVKVFYDSGGDEFGGAMSYARTIGESPKNHRAADNDEAFTPDLFAPVWREYSQRIVLATLSPRVPQFNITMQELNDIGQGGVPPDVVYVEGNATTTMGDITIPDGYYMDDYFITITAEYPSVWHSDPNVPPVTVYYYPEVPNVENTIIITISGVVDVSVVITSYTLTTSTYAEYDATFDNPPAQYFITGVADNFVGIISPSGGVPPYSYFSARGDVSVSGGTVMFNSTGAPKRIVAAIDVYDNLESSEPIPLTITLESVSAVSFSPDVVVGVESTVAVVVLAGGRIINGDILPSGFRLVDNTVIVFATDIERSFIQSITIASEERMITTTLGMPINAQLPPPITTRIIHGGNGAIALVAQPGMDTHGTIAIINPPSGGYRAAGNDYSYNLSQQGMPELSFTLLNNNTEVRYAVSRAITGAATLTIDDESRFTNPFTMFFTLTAVDNLGAILGGGRVFPVNRRATIGTIIPAGGAAPYNINLGGQSVPGALIVEPNGRVILTEQNAARRIAGIIFINDSTDLTPPFVLPLTLETANDFSANNTPITTGILSTIGVVVFPGGAIVGGDSLPSEYRVVGGGSVLLITTNTAGRRIQPITIAGGGLNLALTLTVNVVSPPPLRMSWIFRQRSDIIGRGQGFAILANGRQSQLGDVLITGGWQMPPTGFSALSFHDVRINAPINSNSNFIIATRGANIRSILFNNRRGIAETIIMTVIANDDHPQTPPALLPLTLTVMASVNANFAGSRFIPVNQSGNAGRINPAGGGGAPYRFRIFSQSPRNVININNNGEISHNSQSAAGAITARIEVNDNIGITPPYILTLTMQVVSVLSPNPNAVLVGVQTPVATVVFPNAAVQSPGNLPSGFSLDPGNNAVILFSASAAGFTNQNITITRSGGAPIIVPLNIRANNPAPIRMGIASGHQGTTFIVSGINDDYQLVASITASGGYLEGGSNYNFVIHSGGNAAPRLTNDGALLMNRQRAITAVVVIRAEDDNERTAHGFISVSATVISIPFAPVPSPTPLTFTLGIPGTLGMLTAGGIVVGSPAGIAVSNNAVLFSASVEGAQNVLLTVRAGGADTPFSVPVNAVSPPPIVGNIVAGRADHVFLTGNGFVALIAQVTANGGYLAPGGSYHLTIAHNVPSFRLDTNPASAPNRFIYTIPSTPLTATATVLIDDDNEHTEPASFAFYLTTHGRLSASFNQDSTNRGAALSGRDDAVGRINPAGGSGSFTYVLRQANSEFSLSGNQLRVSASGIPSTYPQQQRILAATIIVDDDVSRRNTPPVTLAATITAYAPIRIQLRELNTIANIEARAISSVGYWSVVGGVPGGLGTGRHNDGYDYLINGANPLYTGAAAGANEWRVYTGASGLNDPRLVVFRASSSGTDNPRTFTLSSRDRGPNNHITPDATMRVTLRIIPSP